MSDAKRPPARRPFGRHTEAVKTAAIAVLAALLVLLLREAGVFSELNTSGLFGSAGGTEDTGTDTGYTAAAGPLCIVVTPETGLHCAVLYDGAALDAAYADFAGSLGMALGSSGEPQAVAEAEWETALSGSGVYFDFRGDQLLSVLAEWLDTPLSSGAGTHTARRLCLARDGDGVALYYARARESGEYYRCTTKLLWSAISELMENYSPNGAQFNFELDTPFSLVAPCSVLLTGQQQVKALTVSNPMLSGSIAEDAMQALGMNSVLASRYPETDGTQVCVEGNCVLRLSPDGRAAFTGVSEEGTAQLSETAAIELGRSVCARTLGVSAGAAELMLTFIYQDKDTGDYTLKFDYVVNGLPVVFSDGAAAAEFTISGGAVTAASLVYRTYAYDGGTEQPLPPMLAAAAVQSSGGGEPVLAYFDDMTAVSACWTID